MGLESYRSHYRIFLLFSSSVAMNDGMARVCVNDAGQVFARCSRQCFNVIPRKEVQTHSNKMHKSNSIDSPCFYDSNCSDRLYFSTQMSVQLRPLVARHWSQILSSENTRINFSLLKDLGLHIFDSLTLLSVTCDLYNQTENHLLFEYIGVVS